MNATVQIDQAGRLVLPKRLRERFRLRQGDTLSLEVKGDVIELRPRKTRLSLERVNGVLVVSTQGPIDQDIVAMSRDERLDKIGHEASGLK